jgi:hypothetical protein
LGHELPQECQNVVVAGELSTAAQPQGLIHGVLEVTVGRLRVAVLVRPTNIDPLARDPVMVEQSGVTSLKLPLGRQVVHRRAQTVTPMPPWDSTQFPERVLQTVR